MADDFAGLANEQFCYVTTRGRKSGKPHEIEIWFSLEGGTLYMLAGGRERSDWVRNIVAEPQVTVRIKDREFSGRGRVVDPGTEEDRLARRLLPEKYSPTYSGDLTGWGETALPIAVDLAT